MPRFTLYRQKRQDGGIRTGLDLDDELVWHSFQAGTEESDPTLLWYVDLRGEGEGVPLDPDELHEWLVRYSEPIRKAFSDLADSIPAGYDNEQWPVRRDVPSPVNDVRLEIVFTAVHRDDVLAMAGRLRQIAASWSDLLSALQRMVPSS